MTESRFPTKAAIAERLKRAGYNPDLINELLTLLHDPVDDAQLEAVFERYGLTLDLLTSRVGGSP